MWSASRRPPIPTARAGYVQTMLGLAGRDDIPVAAGAGVSLDGKPMGELPDHDAYWGTATVTPRPARDGAAVDLMAAGVERGATVIAIGPYTNLALLEAARPGILREARVVLMGGWVYPAADGLPPWGPERTGTCSATRPRRSRCSPRPAT